MPKYKIGITEAGDAGLDLSWANKLDTVDGAIVITKCITPDFYEVALANKDKLIIHATITGYLYICYSRRNKRILFPLQRKNHRHRSKTWNHYSRHGAEREI